MCWPTNSGLRLSALMVDSQKLDEVLTAYGQYFFLTILRCRMQFLENLMGNSANGRRTDLTGRFMDQNKCAEEWERTSNFRAPFTMYLCRLYLAFYFDDDDLAEDMSSRLPQIIAEGPGPWLPSRILFQGLVAFRLARKKKRKWKYLRQGRKCVAWMEKRVAMECINCPHYLALLLAEQQRVINGKSDWKFVQKKYDEAILLSGRLGFLNIQALSNDLAGQFFLEDVGDKDWAKTYLSRSIELYIQWEANGKATYMTEKYSDILQENDSASAFQSQMNIGTHLLSRSHLASISFGSSKRSSGDI
jgi:hypothetical protein